MSHAVVAIVSIFFIIGITVGIITVVALSVLRPRPRGWPGRRLEYGPPDQPPDPDGDEGGPDERPRWPGDTGSDFSGR
jgi:hypothetical protein